MGSLNRNVRLLLASYACPPAHSEDAREKTECSSLKLAQYSSERQSAGCKMRDDSDLVFSVHPPLVPGRVSCEPASQSRKKICQSVHHPVNTSRLPEAGDPLFVLGAEAVLAGHAEDAGDEFDRARRVVVRRDRVRDRPRVEVRVDDADRRDLVLRRFAEGVPVQGRREEDEQVGLERQRGQFRAAPTCTAAPPRTTVSGCVGLRCRDLGPAKDLFRVRDGAGEPLGDAVAVLSEALGVEPHGLFGALEAADKEDLAVALDDALDDLGGAAEGGEGLAEVDVGDTLAGAVDEGEGGAVGVLAAVAEVGAGGDEVRGGQVARVRRAVEVVVRLEGVVAALGRA